MSEFNKAPGCFGSALTFQIDAPECKTCIFAESCQPRSEASLARIRTELGITAPLRKKRVDPPGINDTSHLAYVPKKVAEIIRRMNERGIKIVDNLREGRNPFDAPTFMKVVCHILLKKEDGADRSFLAAALVKTMNWTPETALSHTAQARALLLAVGAVTDCNGILKIRK